jgi:uncharacterized membrane protein HdeD (DUF308 family)
MTGRNGKAMLGLQTITAHWWVFLIRGIIAIVFGIAAIAYPGLTAILFVFIFAGYACADGILTLIAAVRLAHPETGRWWWMILQGVLGIAIGIVTILYPGITAYALGILIAVWAIVTGVLEIAAAVRLRKDIPNEIFLLVIGALSVFVGVILFFEPLTALLAWAWVVGFYAILAGIMLIALAFRLRSRGTTLTPAA